MAQEYLRAHTEGGRNAQRKSPTVRRHRLVPFRLVSLLDDRSGGRLRDRLFAGLESVAEYNRRTGRDLCGYLRLGLFPATVTREGGLPQLIRRHGPHDPPDRHRDRRTSVEPNPPQQQETTQPKGVDWVCFFKVDIATVIANVVFLAFFDVFMCVFIDF